jgi:predicted signal transduction protein with EAL and GGDEF domain
MTGILASGAHSSLNLTDIWISIGVPFVIFVTIAVIVTGWFRLQAHRADAVANASYRKLAEEAVANQQELRAELARLTLKVEAVEKLMRDVG